MKKALGILFGLILVSVPVSSFAEMYLTKFQHYMMWSLHFPATATPEFSDFIRQPTPLSQKLRSRWLYQLARNKDWASFLSFYQPTTDITLSCYAQLAKINQGKETEALRAATLLWLQGHSLPPHCDELFNWLLKNHDPHQSLIGQRVQLALEEQNVSLAQHLLNRFHPPRTADIKLLDAIRQNPKRITAIPPGPLHGAFYLYGLKRLVANQHIRAESYWEHPKAKQLLNEPQSQSFFSHLVIYKSMRDDPDTLTWFAKIKPRYYNDSLLEWQIRYALKHQQWARVRHLIPLSSQHNDPCWQYWLARAHEALGDKDKSTPLYQSLAKSRHYYGFLASLRIKARMNFENEPIGINLSRLNVYHPVTTQIKAFYTNHQYQDASRLTDDFASELPKQDKMAFIKWINDDLQWHSKAISLSNSDDMSNLLALRFPLAFHQSVTNNANRFRVPKELIYAVIRQESGFRESVISPAGAHGLMQVLPATAKKIAHDQKIAYTHPTQLFTSDKNISIGTAYLQNLASHFKNHPILMAAAYNAGPRQVNYWLKNHPPKQIDIWIDTLPWRETRNYIKNIIAFYAVYQYRMNQRADLSWFMKTFD